VGPLAYPSGDLEGLYYRPLIMMTCFRRFIEGADRVNEAPVVGYIFLESARGNHANFVICLFLSSATIGHLLLLLWHSAPSFWQSDLVKYASASMNAWLG